jgi:ABC-type nitrate/sulfonate/bicarbonate transport system substrate-binding protein
MVFENMKQGRNKMRRGIVPLGCTAALLLSTGIAAFLFTAPVVATAPKAAGAAIKITGTDLVPTPNPALAYIELAHEMGLFEKHGLEWIPGPKLGGGGPARVQAVATGATEVAVSDIISVMGAIYSGADLKVLMVMTPYGDEQIWGNKKYKTLKDAQGQPWAVASLGGAQRFNAQMTLEGMGLSPDAFRFTAIPGADGPRLEATVTGRTQIAELSHLGAELAKAKGYTDKIHVLVEHTSKYTPPIPRLVLVAKASWIKSHEEAATHMVEMMLEEGRTSENSAEAWVAPAAKMFKKSGMNAQQLKAAWQELHDGGSFTINGGVNLDGTQKVMNLFFKLRKEKPNEHLSKASDVYDTGPLQKALDKMGLAKGTPGLPDTPDWYPGRTAKKG